MYLEFSYHSPINIYGQPLMRWSSVVFLYYASTLFEKYTVLSMILMANFITSFHVHKRCLIFDSTCDALYYDHIAIATWVCYNLYMLCMSPVHVQNKLYATVCAILAASMSVLRKKIEFRHPIRDCIHCSMHLFGVFGTWFLVK